MADYDNTKKIPDDKFTYRKADGSEGLAPKQSSFFNDALEAFKTTGERTDIDNKRKAYNSGK